MRKLFLLLGAPLLLAATCEDDDDLLPPCTTEVVNGLYVTVINSETSAVIVDGVAVVAVDGSFEESLSAQDNIFTGIPENPGTYIITVTKSGFETYVSDPIAIGADQCHVIPQNLTIPITPL